jgi:pimeloyl-ACP methyl ester carboxylesterase
MTDLQATRQNRLRWIALATLLVSVAGLLLSQFGTARANAAVSGTAGSGTTRSGSRPTVVLVHGAWAGPSSWDRVVARLRDDGYRTATPTLDTLSLEGDVATVRATLDRIPGRKLLVGHSYGGL